MATEAPGATQIPPHSAMSVFFEGDSVSNLPVLGDRSAYATLSIISAGDPNSEESLIEGPGEEKH